MVSADAVSSCISEILKVHWNRVKIGLRSGETRMRLVPGERVGSSDIVLNTQVKLVLLYSAHWD